MLFSAGQRSVARRCLPWISACRRPLLGRGAAGLIGSALVACGSHSSGEVAFVDMLDCTLERYGTLHIHKNREDKNVTVITDYNPKDPDHKAAIARGSKSYGSIRRSTSGNRPDIDVDLFLLKESFGERSNETVTFRFEPGGGRLLVLARTSAGMGWGQDRERSLDQGYCQKR